MNREEAIKRIRDFGLYHAIEDLPFSTSTVEAFEMAIQALEEPERKTGKWKVYNVLDYAQRPTGKKILRCPFCKYMTGEFRSRVDYYHKLTNFCPNCGAKMDGKEAGDE